jgi:hypothetical protein
MAGLDIVDPANLCVLQIHVFFAVRSRRRGSTFMTSEWISDLGKKSLGKKELGKKELGEKSNYPG